MRMRGSFTGTVAQRSAAAQAHRRLATHERVVRLARRLPRRAMSRWFVHFALAAGLGLGACATSTVTNPVSGREERTVMDERAELAQGREAHQQVLAEYGAVADPRLQAYVNEIGQRLAKQSHRADLQWTFTVLDSPQVNAFALPGGFIYVTRGLMAYMDSEADLAGVVGHEIGHVTARHSAQRATRQQRAGLGVLAATVLGVLLVAGGVGGAADAAQQVSSGIAAGSIASYSREQELQADQLGAEYLARVGLNPRNMVDVIGVLRDQERFAADNAREQGRAAAPGPGWLASHPSNEQRLAQITRIAQNYAGRYGDDQRARYLQALDGTVFGDSREQGVVRGRHFLHEPLGIALTAPEGWRFRNESAQLVLVNAAGDAGMVMQAVPPSAGRTHDEILRNGLKATQGRSERTTVNGLNATVFSGQRTGAENRAEPLEVTLVDGPSGRTYALMYAWRDAAALERARSGLRAAVASFRPLGAAERAAARPWVIRTRALPPGGFAELARRSPLGDPAAAERQLRLLNGVYGGGAQDLAPGRPVKVVVEAPA
jgi:predicted Zn-dependent protease